MGKRRKKRTVTQQDRIRLRESEAKVHDLTGQVARLQAEADDPKHKRPLRNRLPATRRSITHKFTVAGHEGYIIVGLYEDGSPGEVFIRMAKMGSTVRGLVDTIAVLTSLALQYGVPIEDLARKFKDTRFEPSGHTRNPEIRTASSIADYIFTWLGQTFSS